MDTRAKEDSKTNATSRKFCLPQSIKELNAMVDQFNEDEKRVGDWIDKYSYSGPTAETMAYLKKKNFELPYRDDSSFDYLIKKMKDVIFHICEKNIN